MTEHVPKSLFSKHIQRANDSYWTNKECPDALDLPVEKPHRKEEHLILDLSNYGFLQTFYSSQNPLWKSSNAA